VAGLRCGGFLAVDDILEVFEDVELLGDGHVDCLRILE
jgi:hypothetical protein